MPSYQSLTNSCSVLDGPSDLVSAVRVAPQHAGDLRDGSPDADHRQDALVHSEAKGATSRTAHPVDALHQRVAGVDLDLEAAVIEFPVVGARHQLEEDRERQRPGPESLQGQEVRDLVSHHPANRIVGPVAEMGLDVVEHPEEGPDRVPTVPLQAARKQPDLEQRLVRRGASIMDRDPVMEVLAVASADHPGDQTVAANVDEFAEHGDPEVRDSVELPAALSAYALQKVRSDEFSQGPADVRQAEARLLRDLNRGLRARNHGGKDPLPLSARKDVRQAVDDAPRSRLPWLHRRTRRGGSDAS